MKEKILKEFSEFSPLVDAVKNTFKTQMQTAVITFEKGEENSSQNGVDMKNEYKFGKIVIKIIRHYDNLTEARREFVKDAIQDLIFIFKKDYKIEKGYQKVTLTPLNN